MKKTALSLLTFVFTAALTVFAEAEQVEVVKCIVVTDHHEKSPNELRVLMYIRNTGDTPVKLLTRNLQAELFSYDNKPKELRITLSSQKFIDGSKVIPSEHDLSPVTLRKGEVAEIKVSYHDRNDLSEVILVYDMRNDIARRYNAWSGIVRELGVKVNK